MLVACPGTEREAQQLASCLRCPTGYALPIDSEADTNCIVLELDPSLTAQLGAEGYQLSVTPKRVVIRASTEAGLFYGGVTLRQLLPVGGVWRQAGRVSSCELDRAVCRDRRRAAIRVARSAVGRGTPLHAGRLCQEVHRSGCAAQVQHAAVASDRRPGLADGNQALSASDRNRLGAR